MLLRRHHAVVSDTQGGGQLHINTPRVVGVASLATGDVDLKVWMPLPIGSSTVLLANPSARGSACWSAYWPAHAHIVTNPWLARGQLVVRACGAAKRRLLTMMPCRALQCDPRPLGLGNQDHAEPARRRLPPRLVDEAVPSKWGAWPIMEACPPLPRAVGPTFECGVWVCAIKTFKLTGGRFVRHLNSACRCGACSSAPGPTDHDVSLLTQSFELTLEAPHARSARRDANTAAGAGAGHDRGVGAGPALDAATAPTAEQRANAVMIDPLHVFVVHGSTGAHGAAPPGCAWLCCTRPACGGCLLVGTASCAALIDAQL